METLEGKKPHTHGSFTSECVWESLSGQVWTDGHNRSLDLIDDFTKGSTSWTQAISKVCDADADADADGETERVTQV